MTNATLAPHVQSKIESLCAQGCNRVNDLLQRAQQNAALEELSSFNPLEKQQIITELTDIMSVYTDKSA